MRSKQIIRVTIGAGLFSIATLLSGCLEKDLYDPTENTVPPQSDYFNFQLKGDVKLNVNYNMPGFKAYIEVYDEYPCVVSGAKYVIKEGLKPKFVAYTDQNGKFEGTMSIPTGMKEAYLYTDRWGLPMCVKLEATANGFVFDSEKYDYSKRTGTASRASGAWLKGNAMPFEVMTSRGESRTDNMYSICDWNQFNDIVASKDVFYNSPNTAKLGELSNRVSTMLDNNRKLHGNNSNYLPNDPNSYNLKITKPDTEVEVTYLSTNGSIMCILGYYYYPNSEVPASTDDLYKIRKYVVFPTSDRYSFSKGNTVKLQYFGPDGKSPASNKFPVGYTIGWFVSTKGQGNDGYSNYVPNLESKEYDYEKEDTRRICFSNDTGTKRNFISLYDAQSKTVVLGTEDSFGYYDRVVGGSDYDFDDLMFFVTTNPGIDNEGGRPTVPGDEVKPEEKVSSIQGTLCFEDNWPIGGDYDMNDVVVEYKRDIYFDGNNYATKAIETFKVVQRTDAAVFDNYFAYQVQNKGTVAKLSENVIDEGDVSKSFVIKQSVKTIIGQSFTIERTFAANAFTKGEIEDDFNPYIITRTYSTKDRSEVHLPMYKPTAFANSELNNTQNDAYYVQRDGAYPYAIDIPVLGFELSPEKITIDTTYPGFARWANSKGTTDKEWYKYIGK